MSTHDTQGNPLPTPTLEEIDAAITMAIPEFPTMSLEQKAHARSVFHMGKWADEDPTPDMTPEDALARIRSCIARVEVCDGWGYVAREASAGLELLRAAVERDARVAAECLKLGISRDSAIVFAEMRGPTFKGIPVPYTEDLENADQDKVDADMWEATSHYWHKEVKSLQSENTALKAKLAESEAAFLERSNAYEDLNSELNRVLEEGTQLEAKIAEAVETNVILRGDVLELKADAVVAEATAAPTFKGVPVSRTDYTYMADLAQKEFEARHALTALRARADKLADAVDKLLPKVRVSIEGESDFYREAESEAAVTAALRAYRSPPKEGE